MALDLASPGGQQVAVEIDHRPRHLRPRDRAAEVEAGAVVVGGPGRRGPRPTILWAYPKEFRDADAAGQIDDSPNRFSRPSGMSHLFLLTQGYAILDGFAVPIIGEGGAEPNDTYVEQLVSSAKAAIDKVVEMGVANRDRIGVGGHSFGAFMTANLLAHSDIFAAGIARSGAYNRTLTPFGFQAEPLFNSEGWSPTSVRVYSWRGCSSTWPVSPASTTRPPRA